jgi:hypothetical protein
MRAVASLFAGALAACAGPSPAPAVAPEPDWRGAPVHLRHLGDGGVEVEYVASTAGHAFELRDAVRSGARAELTFAHRGPADGQLVAQVVTPLRVAVPPAQLGDAAVVAVRIDDGGRTALALVASRPR